MGLFFESMMSGGLLMMVEIQDNPETLTGHIRGVIIRSNTIVSG